LFGEWRIPLSPERKDHLWTTRSSSSSSATINAPIEEVDLPSWCFTLPEWEYKACFPAHCTAGTTTAPDGRRRSINVEVFGDTLVVQHYVEKIGKPDHLRLASTSDLFAPAGRTTVDVIWDLSVKKIDDATCEFTNLVECLLHAGAEGRPCQTRNSGGALSR
jgi:hypothetical protein